MSATNLSNNGVSGTGTRNDAGASPGRCLIDAQRRSGRIAATARMKWNKAINITIVLYLSHPMDENDKPVVILIHGCSFIDFD